MKLPAAAVEREQRVALFLTGAYAVVLAALVGRLSLWVDEIIQILAVKGHTLAETLRHVPENPGGSPLGYLLNNLWINADGASAVSARLPAAAFSVLGCLGIAWLARRLRLGWTVVAILLFMALPIQLRYALEGRPYSQTLFLSLLSTVLALELAEKTTVWPAALYGLVAILGVYTHPFLLLVPVAHLVWVSFSLEGAARRRVQLSLAVAIAVAGLLYLPWYLYAKSTWSQVIVESQWHFFFTAKTPLMLLRELTGGSYWMTIPLVAAAGVGLVSTHLSRSTRVLLACVTVIPAVGALAADAVFDYFLAARQFIPALAGLILLAVAGLRRIEDARRYAGWAVLVLLLAVALVYDVKWFSRPRENWQVAAAALKAQGSSCMVYLPESTFEMYRFFEPELPKKPCLPNPAQPVVVAVSPYARPDEVRPVLSRLRGAGLVRTEAKAAGGVRILVFAAATADTDGRATR